MKNNTSVLTALALAASALSVIAGNTNPKLSTHRVASTNSPSSTAQRRVTSVITALDMDRDGVISSQEIAGAPSALLKLDKNKDNQISSEELQPVRRASRSANGTDAQPTKRQPAPVVSALDVDGDGKLSVQEIAKASAALRKLDKNSDGQLSRDEYRPARIGSAGKRGDKAAKQENGSTAMARHSRAPKAMTQER
jgi:Ca2+-binding EF-hand superfamily protein